LYQLGVRSLYTPWKNSWLTLVFLSREASPGREALAMMVEMALFRNWGRGEGEEVGAGWGCKCEGVR
jgi:hypothetical protein